MAASSREFVRPSRTLLCAGQEMGTEACQHVSYTAVQHIILLGWQGLVCPSQTLHTVQGGQSVSYGQVRCSGTLCLQDHMHIILVQRIAVLCCRSPVTTSCRGSLYRSSVCSWTPAAILRLSSEPSDGHLLNESAWAHPVCWLCC